MVIFSRLIIKVNSTSPASYLHNIFFSFISTDWPMPYQGRAAGTLNEIPSLESAFLMGVI